MSAIVAINDALIEGSKSRNVPTTPALFELHACIYVGVGISCVKEVKKSTEGAAIDNESVEPIWGVKDRELYINIAVWLFVIGIICQFVPDPEKFRFTVSKLENIVTIGLFSIIAAFFFLEGRDMILGQAIRQETRKETRQETINEFAKRIDELRKNGKETYEELDNIVKDMREQYSNKKK
ncbi:MAG: hypothetical protein OXU79_11610 [Gemmatimonadota bacterium]|nr:hypothetical protein [Gemmatimonadota bacterium]